MKRGLTCEHLLPVLHALVAAGNRVQFDNPDRDGPIVSMRKPIDPAVVAMVADWHVVLKDDRVTCDECYEWIVDRAANERFLDEHTRTLRAMGHGRIRSWLGL